MRAQPSSESLCAEWLDCVSKEASALSREIASFTTDTESWACFSWRKFLLSTVGFGHVDGRSGTTGTAMRKSCCGISAPVVLLCGSVGGTKAAGATSPSGWVGSIEEAVGSGCCCCCNCGTCSISWFFPSPALLAASDPVIEFARKRFRPSIASDGGNPFMSRSLPPSTSVPSPFVRPAEVMEFDLDPFREHDLDTERDADRPPCNLLRDP